MELPITKEQYALYEEQASNVRLAQAGLELCLKSILAGHHITKGAVTQVTPDKIILREESDAD